MSDTPFPVARDFRRTDILVGDGGTTYSGFGFKIFDVDDVAVYLRRSTQTEYALESVTVEKDANLDYDDFSVTFTSAVTSSDDYFVIGATLIERNAGVRKGTKIDPDALEREFSRIVMMVNELRRDLNRAVQTDPSQTSSLTLAADVSDNQVLIRSGNRIIGGELLNVASETEGAAVITALATKADLSYVDTELELKADVSSVATGLATKLDLDAGNIDTHAGDILSALTLPGSPTASTYLRRKADNSVWEEKSPIDVLADLDGVAIAAGKYRIKVFISADQTITSAGALDLTHALGAEPLLVFGFLKATTAELGYSVGDILAVPLGVHGDSNDQGISMRKNATKLLGRFGAAANAMRVIHATNGASNAIANSSWKFIAVAIALVAS